MIVHGKHQSTNNVCLTEILSYLHPFPHVMIGRKFSNIASLLGLIRINDAEVKTLHNNVADHYNS